LESIFFFVIYEGNFSTLIEAFCSILFGTNLDKMSQSIPNCLFVSESGPSNTPAS
jgi:hypothetical protein